MDVRRALVAGLKLSIASRAIRGCLRRPESGISVMFTDPIEIVMDIEFVRNK
jgi:hypothetical protein